MSFSTALTGLHGAQSEIATTANNIANIGTTGFKRSAAEFGDIFSTSPSQSAKFAIGSGTLLKSVKQEFSQGNLATSGSTLDIAITGQGFFALKPGLTSAQTIYSRSGSFTVNSDLYVVDSQAQLLQVYPVNSDGSVVATGMNLAKSLQLPATSGLPAATKSLAMAVNLPSDSKVISSATAFDKTDPATFNQSSSVTVYDSLGNPSIATIYYVKTKNADDVSPNNKWQTYVFVGDTEIKPQPMKSKNSQGDVFYINQFGQIATAAQVPDKLSIATTGPLYRQDEQVNKLISQPASVLGSLVDTTVFDATTNTVQIVTDPALYAKTREGAPTNQVPPPNVFWGMDMFTIAVDGSKPQSISVNAGSYTPRELAAELTRAVNSKFDDPGKFTIRDTLRKDGSTVLQGNDIIQVDLLKPDGEAVLSLTNPIEIDLFGSAGSTGTPPLMSPEPTQMDLTRDELVSLAQQKLNDALNKRSVEFQKPSTWPDPANPPIIVGYDVMNRALTFKVDPAQMDQYSSFKVFNPTAGLNDLGIPSRSNSPEALIRSDTQWTGSEALPRAGSFIAAQDQQTGIAVTYDEANKKFQFSSGSTGFDSSIAVGRAQLSNSPQAQVERFSFVDQLTDNTFFNTSHTVSFDVDGRVLSYDFVAPSLTDPGTNATAFFDGLAQAAPVNFRQEKVASVSSPVYPVTALAPYGKLMNGDTFQLNITPATGSDALNLTVGPLDINATDSTAARLSTLEAAVNKALGVYQDTYNASHSSAPISLTCTKNAANQLQFSWTTPDVTLPVSMKQIQRGTDSALVTVKFQGEDEVVSGSSSPATFEQRSLTAVGVPAIADAFTLIMTPVPGGVPLTLSIGPLVNVAGKSPTELLTDAINQAISDSGVKSSSDPTKPFATCSNTGNDFVFDWNTAGRVSSPILMYQSKAAGISIPASFTLTDATIVGAIPAIQAGSSGTQTIQTIALTSPGGGAPVFQKGDVYRVSIPGADGSVVTEDILIDAARLTALTSGAKSFDYPVTDPGSVPSRDLLTLEFSRGASGTSVRGVWKANGAILGAMSIDQIKAGGVQVRPIDIGPLSIGRTGNFLEVSGGAQGDAFRLKTRIDGVLLSKDPTSKDGYSIGSAPLIPDFTSSNVLLGIAGKNEAKGSGLKSTPATAVGARAITPMNMTFIPDLTKKENEITVSVDGVVGTVILPIGPYNGLTLASAIQDRVNRFEDPKTGHKIGGVSVKFDDINNRLIFTSGSMGPGSQINVLGPANYGLRNVTQTAGLTPTWTKPTQAVNTTGSPLFVNAKGEITAQPDIVDKTKWYPLYLDEGELTFDTFGKVVSPFEAMNYSPLAMGNGAAPLDLSIDFGKTSTQFNAPFSVMALTQDGYASGSMNGLDIDASGTVRVSYTNGQSKALGKIMLATFANVNGLQQIGNADYVATAVSGEARMGQAGSGGFGTIKSGALEQSNVDVTDELVKLITSQRNFQASAKMIDTQKQLTETLIQIR